MLSHPGTWARRTAFGIDTSKPGVEDNHFICAGYYSCTETGLGEIVTPCMHVFAVIKYEYEKNVSSDRQAAAFEPMNVTHIESTVDGLSIKVFGKVLLNWPRLQKYTGADLLPKTMQDNPSLYGYSDWEVSVEADVQEGFVGVRIGRPSAPPDLAEADEDTIGCIGYIGVRQPHPAYISDSTVLVAECCLLHRATALSIG